MQYFLFPLAHLGLHGAFVEMVIAQQVQHGVDGEVADLPLEAVAVFPGLGFRVLQGDGHVAQGQQARLGIEIAAQIRRQPAGGEVEHGERQHVRGGVDPAGGQIDGPDALVVGDEHVDLAVCRNALGLQGGADALAQMQIQPDGVQPPLIKGDDDMMIHGFVLRKVLPGAFGPSWRFS